MQISNTIKIDGNIFFKLNIRGVRYIKLIPCYDVEHGIVLKMTIPSDANTVLDKSWIKISLDHNNELFEFNCPSFLHKYKNSSIAVYEDAFPSVGEVCRIRKAGSDFSLIKHLIKIPRKSIYEPYFSVDGKFHISLAYVRNNFPVSVKKNPYVKLSNIDNIVINRETMVYVFSERNLNKNEIAFKLNRSDYELVTRPISYLSKIVGPSLERFKYKKYSSKNDVMIIYLKERKYARPEQRVRRPVCGIRQRAIRVRRARNAGQRTEAIDRGKTIFFDFQRG